MAYKLILIFYLIGNGMAISSHTDENIIFPTQEKCFAAGNEAKTLTVADDSSLKVAFTCVGIDH